MARRKRLRPNRVIAPGNKVEIGATAPRAQAPGGCTDLPTVLITQAGVVEPLVDRLLECGEAFEYEWPAGGGGDCTSAINNAGWLDGYGGYTNTITTQYDQFQAGWANQITSGPDQIITGYDGQLCPGDMTAFTSSWTGLGSGPNVINSNGVLSAAITPDNVALGTLTVTWTITNVGGTLYTATLFWIIAEVGY